MPSENEELDVFKNKKWRPFVNTLRGAPSLHDEEVLREFDRSFIPSLRRACKLLKVRELITACIEGEQGEIDRLRHEHRKQRDRAETFADLILNTCRPGMTYRAAVDAFVHGACNRIIDQGALAVVPSDNFPTLEDYRQASAIWLFSMEPRIVEIVDQIMDDPTKLRVQRFRKKDRDAEFNQELSWSMLDHTHKELSHGDSIPHTDQEP